LTPPLNNQPVTHYADENNGGSDLYCVGCGGANADLEPMTGDADGYDDVDCTGALLDCAECSGPLFPAAYAAYKAELAHMESEYRSGRLGASIGRTGEVARQQHLDAMARDDLAAFYIGCKDHPEDIEAEAERRMGA